MIDFVATSTITKEMYFEAIKWKELSAFSWLIWQWIKIVWILLVSKMLLEKINEEEK